MPPVPQPIPAPTLTDPASQPSLQFVVWELDLRLEEKRACEEPEPTPPPRPKPPSPRQRRRERKQRRRARAARRRARWRAVSPFVAAQFAILGMGVALAEWLEVHGGQPFAGRFAAACATSMLTAVLWAVFLRKQRGRGPQNLTPT